MNIELNQLQIFGMLVLGCMDSYDSESRIFWFSFFQTQLASLAVPAGFGADPAGAERGRKQK